VTGFHQTFDLGLIISESIGILAPGFPKTAKEEAYRIAAALLSVPPSKIRLDMARMTVDATQKNEIIEKVHRRLKHEPLQYIMGSSYFMGEEFTVGEGVLIPRADTEILVEEALKIAKEWLFPCFPSSECPNSFTPGDFGFLEFCTGSGCIALSFIKKMKEAGFDINGVATDISCRALSYAAENARRLHCSSQIQIVQWDMMSDLSDFAADHENYQMILANPPYIKTQVIPTLEPEVALYEPPLALDGGSDGMRFYHRIAECAKTMLAPGGWILLEIGYDQENEIQKLFEEAGFFEKISVKKDYGGNPRVAIGRKKERAV